MGVTPEYYPDTHVFINKLGITKAADLSKAEADITLLRSQSCLDTPPGSLTFDLPHLQRIHRYLFQDLYNWAGQLRGGDMRKGICVFCPHERIIAKSNIVYSRLHEEELLAGLDKQTFTERIAEYYDLTNRIHPFPEGNGRVQRLFCQQLARQAGWDLDWTLIHSWQINETAIQSFQGNKEPLLIMFEEIIREHS